MEAITSPSSTLPYPFIHLHSEITKYLKISEIAIFTLTNTKIHSFYPSAILQRTRELGFQTSKLDEALNYLQELFTILRDLKRLKLSALEEKNAKDPEELICVLQHLNQEELFKLFLEQRIYLLPLEKILIFLPLHLPPKEKINDDIKKLGVESLAMAVRNGPINLCLRLLKNGAPTNYPDFTILPPLHRATWLGDIDKIKLLLEHDADINCLAFELTPLLFALIAEHTDLLEMLLKHGADPNIYGIENKTALAWAEELEFEDAITLLKQYGARL